MNRILLHDADRVTGSPSRFVLRRDPAARDERADHVRSVLRAAVGDRLRVGLLDGPLGAATILDDAGDSLLLECEFESTVPPRPDVDLVLALPRPKAWKRLLPQVTALGVDRVVLLQAARVEKPYFSSQWLDERHYAPLIHEGLMQSGATAAPRITIEPLFRPFVEDRLAAFAGDARAIVLDPAAPRGILETLRADRYPASRRVVLIVGPEGGFVPFERDLLAGAVPRTARLLSAILRSETAVLAALALVAAWREDVAAQ
jgi:RsmE family RNA methyltransferase